MKMAMVSQPMNGKTEEEIREVRERAIAVLKEKGYEVVDTLFTDAWYSDENLKEQGVVQTPVYFLSASLLQMSKCDVVYFCDGWEKARGCRLEHDVAMSYGLHIVYE